MAIVKSLRLRTLLAITLVVLTEISAAKDDKKTATLLIEKASELSDIRTERAPGFRMEGSFRIIPKKGGKEVEGTYTEIWVSKMKWRREVQTSSFHNVEVRAADSKWLADSGSERPDPVFYGPLTLVTSDKIPQVHRVSERELGTTKATCVESTIDDWSKGLDCVDPDAGTFLMRGYQMSPPNGLPPVHHSCVYRNYEKFGTHLFPRSIHCANDPEDDIELAITKFTMEASPDENLFLQPPGAVETARTCHGRLAAPRTVLTLDPSYPPHHHESVTVVLFLTITADGKPFNPVIARSAGKDFDQAALDAIRNWRFKAPTCDGIPYPASINVEMPFR
jgi:TonB family protein